ncbi:MAG: ATP phosphoribosyltransferase [Pseudomonadota bacterium]
MSSLVLGVPSKGRLMQDTRDWFAARGIDITVDSGTREYAATVEGVAGLSVQLISAGEVPGALAAGKIDLGVTGEDLIQEQVPEPETRVRAIARMGFGHADLIVAVPAFWIDVETMHDLDEAAHAFRQHHGRALRVATKYHTLARRFFHRKGVADYRIVDSQGATEAAPRNLTADVIVDITSTGSTLRANHLKVLEDGLILRSQAVLWIGAAADRDPDRAAAREALFARLGADAPA